jgi:hypothetical protein
MALSSTGFKRCKTYAGENWIPIVKIVLFIHAIPSYFQQIKNIYLYTCILNEGVNQYQEEHPFDWTQLFSQIMALLVDIYIKNVLYVT